MRFPLVTHPFAARHLMRVRGPARASQMALSAPMPPDPRIATESCPSSRGTVSGLGRSDAFNARMPSSHERCQPRGGRGTLIVRSLRATTSRPKCWRLGCVLNSAAPPPIMVRISCKWRQAPQAMIDATTLLGGAARARRCLAPSEVPAAKEANVTRSPVVVSAFPAAPREPCPLSAR